MIISKATCERIKDEPRLVFTERGKLQARGKCGMEVLFGRRSADAA